MNDNDMNLILVIITVMLLSVAGFLYTKQVKAQTLWVDTPQGEQWAYLYDGKLYDERNNQVGGLVLGTHIVDMKGRVIAVVIDDTVVDANGATIGKLK